MGTITEPGTYVCRITAERDIKKFDGLTKKFLPARVFTYSVEQPAASEQQFEDTVVLHANLSNPLSKAWQLHKAAVGFGPDFLDALPPLVGRRLRVTLTPSVAREDRLRVQQYAPA
jgi:hypothetical protein